MYVFTFSDFADTFIQSDLHFMWTKSFILDAINHD